MSCPVKYREIGDFHEYYSGARTAPYLTIFVGGNHEASSHLWELYYGGWCAPNIYYMGAANVVRLGPIRIAGMSGIWKGYNYNKPHHERLPYSDDDVKSIYHIRELDVRKLLQIRQQVDIGISHDWPRAIERHGNDKALWRMKPDFERESTDGTLGNQAATYVMDRLRPPYWFAAHMHCKFAATKVYEEDRPTKVEMPNGTKSSEIAPLPELSVPIAGTLPRNEDEIDLDMDEDDEDQVEAPQVPTVAAPTSDGILAPTGVTDDVRALLPASFARPPPSAQRGIPGQPVPDTITNKTVRFLALDKCLPGRKFLQLLDIMPASTSTLPVAIPAPTTPRYRLQYDPEWLAITRAFAAAHSLVLGDRTATNPPDLGASHYEELIDAELAWVATNITPEKLDIPLNFTLTAPVFIPGSPEIVSEGPKEYSNPQTQAFCDLIGIENLFHASEEERVKRMQLGPPPSDRPQREFGNGRGRGGRGGGRGFGGGRGRGRGRGRGGRW